MKAEFNHFTCFLRLHQFLCGPDKNDSVHKKPAGFGDGFCVEHEPTIQKQTNDFLTKKELKDRLNLPSTRMVDEMMRKRMIPFQKLGHRTIRFNWEKVKAALEKFEHKAVGQK